MRADLLFSFQHFCARVKSVSTFLQTYTNEAVLTTHSIVSTTLTTELDGTRRLTVPGRKCKSLSSGMSFTVALRTPPRNLIAFTFARTIKTQSCDCSNPPRRGGQAQGTGHGIDLFFANGVQSKDQRDRSRTLLTRFLITITCSR